MKQLQQIFLVTIAAGSATLAVVCILGSIFWVVETAPWFIGVFTFGAFFGAIGVGIFHLLEWLEKGRWIP